MNEGQAVTISFLTLAFCQLWHIFNMRGSQSGLFRNEIVANSYVWYALGLCVTLLLLAVYVPALSRVLSLEDPGRGGWLLVVLASSITVFAGQIVRVLAGRFADKA
jgi:Ca2+-transporting ATPase